MKIKQELVTNSSSMSFIVKYTTPVKVAKHMLEIMLKEYIDVCDYSLVYQEKVNNALNWTKQNSKFDKNISIPFTCNYETFLIEVDWFPHVYTETCNNHYYWDGIQKTYSEIYNDDIFKIDYNEEFFDLETFEFNTKKGILRRKYLYFIQGDKSRLPSFLREE